MDLIEDRAAIEMDHVGHRAAMIDRLGAERKAAIETGQFERAFDSHFFEGFVICEFLNVKDDIAEVRGELGRQLRDRRARNRLDPLRARRQGLTFAHRSAT